jgi:tetratricopeptide (TPR) repeat protein
VNRSLAALAVLVTASLLMQGFQCSSTQSLKKARDLYSQKKLDEAKTATTQVLTADSSNVDAWLLLGQINKDQSDLPGMVSAFNNARAVPGIKPQQRDQLSINLYNVWAEYYNAGIASYNAYVSSKSDTDRKAALDNLSMATTVKPEFTEPLPLKGQLLELAGDTTAALAAYGTWWEAEKPGFDVSREKRVTMGQTRADVLKALGTPITTKMDTAETTVIFKDKFDVGGREYYVFSAQESGKLDAAVEGWSYNPPASLSDAEKWRSRVMNLNPLKSMAFIHFNRGNNDQSLDLCNIVIGAAPSDQEIVPLRTQLLLNTGRSEEALNELRKMMAAEPTNTTYRIQYAVLLGQLGRDQEAIAEYVKVLETEPKNDIALYNLGAAYKNIASQKQKVENEKADADKKYVRNESYLEDLKKSAEYFERLRALPKYAADLGVLEQLVNIYEVRAEKSKVKGLIMELEGLSAMYENNLDYYILMEGLYARQKNMDKMKEMQAKQQELKK